MHNHNESGSGIVSGQVSVPVKDNNTLDARFIATLSDGSTAVEEKGQWVTKYGERKPWVRLTQWAAKEKLHLTSLRLNIDGRTIHMPREKFDKFSIENVAPDYYSLSYHLEVDDAMSGQSNQTYFIDLAAHYDESHMTVHYIQDTTDGNNSWVVVTKDDQPIVPSPRRKK